MLEYWYNNLKSRVNENFNITSYSIDLVFTRIVYGETLPKSNIRFSVSVKTEEDFSLILGELSKLIGSSVILRCKCYFNYSKKIPIPKYSDVLTGYSHHSNITQSAVPRKEIEDYIEKSYKYVRNITKESVDNIRNYD